MWGRRRWGQISIAEGVNRKADRNVPRREGENSRWGGWYFLEQDARLPGLNPGTERTRAGGGPGRSTGGRRLRVPTSSLRAGVRIAPVPGS